MDTSATYIKMCEKAVPDIHYTGSFNTLVGDRWGIHLVHCDVFYFDGKGHAIWLPRQDQLQEVVIGNRTPCQLSWDFHYWRTNQSWGHINDPCLSMEQFWLAFVMREKYSKVWIGEEWEGGK